jgi:hypothetical protein
MYIIQAKNIIKQYVYINKYYKKHLILIEENKHKFIIVKDYVLWQKIFIKRLFSNFNQL